MPRNMRGHVAGGKHQFTACAAIKTASDALTSEVLLAICCSIVSLNFIVVALLSGILYKDFCLASSFLTLMF